MGGTSSELSGGRRGSSEGTTKYQDFGSGMSAVHASNKFYDEHSNSNDWRTNELTSAEKTAIRDYTGESGISYHEINSNMYTTPYEDMPPEVRERCKQMESGLDKFVLDKGIQVTRKADFKIFGAKSGEQMTVQQVKDYIKSEGKNGVLQNNGFLSAGSNNHGAAIDGDGLVIHFKVPPSMGAGAYINPISKMSGSTENEFLFNSKGLFKFSNVHEGSDGRVHVTAVWVGRGSEQVFKKKKK